MTSYLFIYSRYQKCAILIVFQYKIFDRIIYLLDLYDNFEIFRKKFQWGRIFENGEAAREISIDFQCENGFELTKYRRINLVTIVWVAVKMSLIPPPHADLGHISSIALVFVM